MKKKISKSENIIKYWKQRDKLNAIIDNATLSKWKVLSAAEKIGKEVWGHKFTVQRLSDDMEMPYTTVKRCLSLNKANKKTWAAIKAKKISVFRVALILQLKSITYQDEIVALAIKDNLSTYQIKSLKIKELKDIKLERQRIATEKGYSRKSSAYLSFITWINKGQLLLLMDKSHLPKDKREDIQAQLKKLNTQIEEYIK